MFCLHTAEQCIRASLSAEVLTLTQKMEALTYT